MSQCDHQHAHAASDDQRRLILIMGMVTAYLLAEIVGGLWTNSLSLLADAGHMFSDLAALGLSLWVARFKLRAAGGQYTYGFHRAEVLGALANGATLMFVAGGIVWESWERLQQPQEILGSYMLWIAVGGLAVNLASLSILHGGHQHDLNMRGAWLHILGDTLGSVAVITAAGLVWCWNWTWVDPVASLLVCAIIVFSSWNLLRESAGILMEYAPSDILVPEVEAAIRAFPGVNDVHCLHVWTIASGLRAITAHVVLSPNVTDPSLLADLQGLLESRFSAQHVTLQIEPVGFSGCHDGCPIA